MKKLLVILSMVLFAMGAHSQTVVRVSKAGLLHSTLKEKNLDPQVITNLKLLGKIDARDFYFMRDSMPALSKLDLAKVNIKAYGDNAAQKIPDFAFFNVTTYIAKTSLTSIILPTNLISIGLCSFRECAGLSGELVIPGTVTEIGMSSFVNCTGLTGNLVIPNSVSRIKDGAFRDCSGLNGNLILPNSLKYIEAYAFYNCSQLKGNLILPETLELLGAYSFSGCSGFTGNLNIPSKLRLMEAGTFGLCSGFNGYLRLPANLRSIGNAAFGDCSGLTGELSFPESLNSIGSNAFSGCINITGKLVLPKSLFQIGTGAFENCSGLTELNIPSSLKEISWKAFSGCYKLEKIVIPFSVETINSQSFENCYNLQFITFGRSIPIVFNESAYYGVNKTNCTLIVPFGTRYNYKYSYGYSDFVNIVDSSCFVNFNTSGGSGVPDAIVPINSLIEQPVTPKKAGYSFGGWLIEGDTANYWNFGSDLVTQNISLYAKWIYSPNVIQLDSAGNLNEKIRSLGLDPVQMDNIKVGGFIDIRDIYYMRDSMPMLSVIDMSQATIMAYGNSPANKLPDYSFYNADLQQPKVYFTSIKMPLNLTAIGNYALAWCSGLKDSLYIPVQVKEIGIDAFRDCNNLNGHFNLPESLVSINYGAFSGCTKITGELKIPNSVTQIKAAAFASSGISGDLIIPNSINFLDFMTFSGCSGLNGKLVIPSSVSIIQFGVFMSCINLKKVIVGQQTPLSIEMFTFQGLNQSACELVVPKGSKELYQNADYWKEFNPINEAIFVTFNTKGGSAVNDIILNVPDKLVQPTAPVKIGHSLLGWYKEADCLNLFNFNNDSVKTNTTLFAKWEIKNFTVSFDSKGGSYIPDTTVLYNTLVNEPKTPIRKGYKFRGWFLDSLYSRPWNFLNDSVKSDMVLYAKWQIKKYKVEFVISDTSSYIISANYNGRIDEPETPVLEGYTFGGWYKDTLYAKAWDFNVDFVTKNVILYAKWVQEGAQDVDKLEISISPNPAIDFLSIRGDKIYDVIISNTSGVTKLHLCFSGKESAIINISSLNSGWYVIKVKPASGNWQIMKFRKE